MFDAGAHLDSLAPIGWTLGLDRMEALCAELGRPQDEFESIHVVGTNGKSSTTRMIAAIAGAHGVSTGCTLSPHLERWTERVMIAGREIATDRFAAAVERAVTAAGVVEGGFAEGEFVTQFELVTAAAYLALAEAGVDLAVIEAGLGGRLDATNSINSRVTVLTSIGIDHTEYLGETRLEIAAEKLAVLRPGTTLVLGDLPPDAAALADRKAAGLGCRVVRADRSGGPDPAERRLNLRGEFQRQNFAVARAAAEVFLGELDQGRVGDAAADIENPGRLQQVSEDPPVFVDVAHNRHGAAALARTLPEIAGGRPVVALFGALADKDAPGILEELAPGLQEAVFTELPEKYLTAWGRPGARSWTAPELCRLAAGAGLACEERADAVTAFSLARDRARESGGIVLVAGSHFLLPASGLV